MAADKFTGAGYGGNPLHEGEDLVSGNRRSGFSGGCLSAFVGGPQDGICRVGSVLRVLPVVGIPPQPNLLTQGEGIKWGEDARFSKLTRA